MTQPLFYGATSWFQQYITAGEHVVENKIYLNMETDAAKKCLRRQGLAIEDPSEQNFFADFSLCSTENKKVDG